MSESTTNTTVRYRHVVGGETYGTPHEAGDPVSPEVPQAKVREWLAAGVITAVRAQRPRKKEHDGGTEG